jgi:putative tryptophan/tyrosine transport system substrate-binding protein
VKRRAFITLVGGAATGWPLAARAQQPKLPTIGVLLVESPGSEQFGQQLREELRKLGYVDGQSHSV